MAHTTKQLNQQAPASDQQHQQVKSAQTREDNPEVVGNSLQRFSSQRPSKTHPTESKSINIALESFNRHQPSKVFVNKCRTELQTLLDSIKDSYHDEIKSLYGDELYADFFIQIGEQFQKPLHKCIIASRAFKFFSALRAFKLDESSVQEDIIVSAFQAKEIAEKKEEEITQLDEKEDTLNVDSPDVLRAKEEKLREALEPFKCQLSEDLVNPELLLNFARRAYLDQDLVEEEIHLNQRITAWLKINRPELVRSSVKCSPDHRESFRTIQPDFSQLSISGSTPAMSTGDQSVASLQKPSADIESNSDDCEETSQAISIRDESITGSLLTRAETFELIPKSRPESPVVSDTPTKNATDSTDGESRKRSDTGGDLNESESSEAYAPTTRTGLKPKKFTTPVDVRTNKTGTASKAGGVGSRLVELSSKTVSKTPGQPVACSGSSNKQTSSGSNPPTAAKRSSLSTSTSDNSKNSSKSSTPAKPKTNSTSTAPGKTKPTIIVRAHPISMERSQSPGTSLTKGSTKNFIAVNKRLVAQMDKKLASAHGDNATNYDSETEISDASFLTLEPLTTENLTAQLDKFTLTSYSKLAEALSRMFIDGILTDSIIHVKDGKHINAHKCILAVRSPYLNDFISQQCLPLATSESVASKQLQPLKIDLSEFSYSVVYFSMLHIYSGIVKVPDDLDLEELARLSHLLHVNTLRQVCMHNLRMNYCHYFHKPCNVCCFGVLKTLPLAWRYDYTELYSKCLQWIGSYFANIFCLEEFSKLKPNDLIEECYNATLSQLSPDNVIPKTIECQKLLKNLPRVKWTESIICLVGRQLEDFCHYVADNYEKILQTESFLNLGKSCWECEVLEENLLAAMNHLKPDSGCKTLIQLDKIECSIETYGEEPRNVSETFASLISKMRKYCERYLLKEASSVVHCTSWRQMNPSLQKRIKDQALLATDFDEPNKQLAAKPKLPSMLRHQRSSPSPQLLQSGASNSGSEDARSPSNRSTPDSRLKSPSTTYLPPPKNKPAATRQVKVLK